MTSTAASVSTRPVEPSPRPYRVTKIVTPDGVSMKILASNGDEMAILRSAGGRKEANAEMMISAMNNPRFDLASFHNALRVMQNIDQHELVEAGVLDATDREQWMSFSEHPYNWFIRCDDETAEKLWALITARMAGRR